MVVNLNDDFARGTCSTFLLVPPLVKKKKEEEGNTRPIA
jgi:hypothetical protein